MRYKTLGLKWLFEQPAPHKNLVSVDNYVARTPQRFHTASRYASYETISRIPNLFYNFNPDKVLK
jgi:hypothetical protein